MDNNESIALKVILAAAKARGVTTQQVALELAEELTAMAAARKQGEKQEKLGLPVDRFGVIPLPPDDEKNPSKHIR